MSRTVFRRNSLLVPILCWQDYITTCSENNNNDYSVIEAFYIRLYQRLQKTGGNDIRAVHSSIKQIIHDELMQHQYSNEELTIIKNFFDEMLPYWDSASQDLESGLLGQSAQMMTWTYDDELYDADSQRILSNKRISQKCEEFPSSILNQINQFGSETVRQICFNLAKQGYFSELFAWIEQQEAHTEAQRKYGYHYCWTDLLEHIESVKVFTHLTNNQDEFWNLRRSSFNLVEKKRILNFIFKIKNDAEENANIYIKDLIRNEICRLQLSPSLLKEILFITEKLASLESIDRDVILLVNREIHHQLSQVQAKEVNPQNVAAFSETMNALLKQRLQQEFQRPLQTPVSPEINRRLQEPRAVDTNRFGESHFMEKWYALKWGWKLLPWYKKAIIVGGAVLGFTAVVACAVFVPPSMVFTIPGIFAVSSKVLSLLTGGLLATSAITYGAYQVKQHPFNSEQDENAGVQREIKSPVSGPLATNSAAKGAYQVRLPVNHDVAEITSLGGEQSHLSSEEQYASVAHCALFSERLTSKQDEPPSIISKKDDTKGRKERNRRSSLKAAQRIGLMAWRDRKKAKAEETEMYLRCVHSSSL